ncbi:MAG TPA: GTP-binding protein [Thermoplasmata archaeon]|nr:GTP-binding protein [Thermoplasmata archaeon]
MAASLVKKKVVLLGDGAVGKTSLVRRFVIDKFSDEYIATIGTKVTKKDFRLDGPHGPVDLTMMLWDVLGQRDYQTTHESSIRGARGAIVVYDVSRPDTAASAQTFWLPLLSRVAGPVPYVLIGNKVDLVEDRKAAEVKLKEIAKDVPASLCSAKTGESVEAGFLSLGERLLWQAEAPEVTVEEGAAAGAAKTIAAVTDLVISDFCKGFGGVEHAMPVVRQQFARAGIDVNHPTREGLQKAIHFLGEVEKDVRTPEEVSEARGRRLAWLREAK